MKKYLAFAAAGVAAITAASAANAGGFYLQEQSVRATGRAYSGEVADQGVESLWWNPAAIARSGREAYVGAHAIFVHAHVQNAGSTITYPAATPLTLPIRGEQTSYDPINDGVVPNFAVATPIGDRFAVGFSMAAPFNVTTEYSPTSWARYDALQSRLTTADFQLTGAMRVTDWLDVGVSGNAEFTDAKLSTAYPNLSPLLPDGISQLSGEGWNYGWTAGAQAHLGRTTLGVSYRSAMDHDLDGRVFVGGLVGPLAAANIDGYGTASFTTPWIATVGGRFALTDKLTLNAQVQRFGWKKFDAIDVVQETPAGNVPQSLAQNYKNTTSGAVGVDYDVSDRLTLRAGVQYDPTPTPDNERTARVPDGDRYVYAVGATATVNPALKIDAAFAYIDFQNSTVNHDTTFYAGTPAATTTRLRGTVTGTGYVMSLGLRTSF